MFAHLSASGLSRFSRKRVGVGATFQRPWLDATGSQADTRFGNQAENGKNADAIAGCAAVLLPGQPDVYGAPASRILPGGEVPAPAKRRGASGHFRESTSRPRRGSAGSDADVASGRWDVQGTIGSLAIR